MLNSKFKNIKTYILLMILFFLTNCSKAQTVNFQEIEISVTLPEISLINIKPDNATIILSAIKHDIAGEKIDFISNDNNSLWLNYTTSIAHERPFKNISAQIVSGKVPDGLALKLKISDYFGSGKGQFGIPISTIYLEIFPKIIMTDIGGCYTREGINNGHKLQYVLEVTDYKLLNSENSGTLTILYTLNDN